MTSPVANLLVLGSLPLAIAGVLLGSLCNLAVFAASWQGRWVSPWAPAGSPPRQWVDRLPIAGWLRLRREVSQLGTRYWLAPLLVELGLGIGVPVLYYWQVVQQRLINDQLMAALPGSGTPLLATAPASVSLALFAAQLLLLAFMTVASAVDADEKIIPDIVTVPGTLLGLLLALALPWSRLPDVGTFRAAPRDGQVLRDAAGRPLAAPGGPMLWVQPLNVASPQPLPSPWRGAPAPRSLAVAIGCYLFWVFAIMPRSWYTRHGWRRAWIVFLARLARSVRSSFTVLLAVAGTVVLAGAWWTGGMRWSTLLSALIGMAAGGAVVWGVRIVGGLALRKEAMGFGDVTLMMMIGTFVGWQPCLLVFFLAPLAALIVGVTQWILNRDHVIPYGPFLCFTTVMMFFQWGPLWACCRPVFGMGWLMPAAVLVCFGLMWAMLSVWHIIARRHADTD